MHKRWASWTNMLGAGHILVQRFEIFSTEKEHGKRELSHSNLRPSLPDAVAGDITAAMPYRAMVNIINFIQAMDHVIARICFHRNAPLFTRA